MVPTKENNLKLVRIVSYLTFDGHLYKDLSGFYLSSNNINTLNEFQKEVKELFNLISKRLEKNNYCYGNKNYKLRFFNTQISKYLQKLGTPEGNKTLTEFRVPNWIKNNKNLSKEYLKIAYFCEGCNKEKRKNPRIQFNINKSKNKLENGLNFINDLKDMLKQFNIETGKTTITTGNIRKDLIITKQLKFRILTRDNKKFINKIKWIK